MTYFDSATFTSLATFVAVQSARREGPIPRRAKSDRVTESRDRSKEVRVGDKPRIGRGASSPSRSICSSDSISTSQAGRLLAIERRSTRFEARQGLRGSWLAVVMQDKSLHDDKPDAPLATTKEPLILLNPSSSPNQLD